MKKNREEIEFICPKCKFKENIPTVVVEMLDASDGALIHTSFPPRFGCQKCNGQTVPIHYVSVYGIEHTYSEN